MKLSVAVLSAVYAKREPDAERRLEKIRGKAADFKSFAENNDFVSAKRLVALNDRVDRLIADLESINVSACPVPGVEEGKFADEEDSSELCDASGKFPSMVRSYARTFGCQDGFKRKNFLNRLVNRTHKLKKKTRKAARCEAPAPVTTATSIVTGTPHTEAPMLEMCDKDHHAVCEPLTNSEIYFENQWTCRNCFRVRATYGQNSGFKFNPAKGDFVSVRFTEPVVWQTFNHPVEKVTEVGDDNTWKIDFKHDGNFMSGMIFEGNLQTSDDDLHVDGNWIIEAAEQCKCKEGPPPPPPCSLSDPCEGKPDCETFINACAVTPSRNNRIATINGSAGYVVSAEVQCGESSGAWGGIVHINTGTSREVFGDRYFTLWARPDGGIKFNAPLKDNGEFHEVEYNPSCTPGEWNTYTVAQEYVDNVLELSISVNGEILGTHVVPADNAFEGELFVEVAGDYHPAADTFKVRNFYHQKLQEPTGRCDAPVDPCDGDDSCDALVDNCPIRPMWSNLLGEVDGDAVYSASVDVFCKKTSGYGWQNVVHMTQGTNRDQFGDRYFTIWQHADGRLKLNGPLKGNTEFHEVEYYVDCDDNSWTNIAIAQTQLEGGLLELSMYQDGDLLGSHRLHSRDAYSGPIKVYASNPFMPPAEFFKIRNFVHRSAPYEDNCVCSDPCDGIANCETFVDSCAIAPWRGTRLADTSAHEQYKISAEVFCTDRVASNWENVLHVHTGTNRENFGDRYFTIWKQGGHADKIRIVAPAFDNPNYELNAYVDCAPGWHTFTVQQSKLDQHQMNLEIIFDGEVVESQAVHKNDLYDGQIFVDVSNEFAWPAAYDHLVRNFYHQDIACADPCFGKENCETIVNECEIFPARNQQLTTVEASLNFKTSADVLCDHDVISGQYTNILHITGGGNVGEVGDRTFGIWRRPNENKLHLTVNDPAHGSHQKTINVDCRQGDWNTYSVEVRQLETNPSVLKYVLSIDDEQILEGFYEKSATLSEGALEVWAADNFYDAATSYAVRNFYYQTFEEVPDIACDDASDPCDELENCNTIVNSCAASPLRDTQVSTVSSSLNYKFSADVLCSHAISPDGQYKNILHVTGGGNVGESGDRTFGIWRTPNESKLHLTVDDSGKGSHQSTVNVDCIDGEWNTYSVEVRQLEIDPSLVQYVLAVDGVQVDQGIYTADNVFTEGDLQVFISDDFYDSATLYSVRNFYHQTFDELQPLPCDSTDPCDLLDKCTTIVDSCAVSPVRNTEKATLTASLNYRISADVLCNSVSELDGQYKNILHVTGGGNVGAAGDRTFGIWRRPNEHKLHLTVNDPNSGGHQKTKNVNCINGEWNTYSVEVRQVEDAQETLRYVLSVDGNKIMDGTYESSGALSEGNLQAFVADEWYGAATPYSVRNFYYQDLTCPSPCDGKANCETFVNECEVFPARNQQLATVEAALNFKASAEVYCDHAMPLDGRWKNVLRIGGGGDLGQIGDRVFAIWRRPNQNRLYISINDPTTSHKERVTTVDCNQGEWNTYSVEVRQLESNPSILKYVLSVDDEEIFEGSYDKSGTLSEGALQVSASDDFYESATTYAVRNFYYQTFDDVVEVACTDGTDPCDGLENCSTFVDSCAVRPSRNNQVSAITPALSYKLSADVLCNKDLSTDGQWRNILRVGNGSGDLGQSGNRVFALWRRPNQNRIYISVDNPTTSHHEHVTTFACTDGEWNTYSVEVNQRESDPSVTEYSVTVDGEEVIAGSYSTFQHHSTTAFFTNSDLQVFISDDYYEPASVYSVRNFFYQTFE